MLTNILIGVIIIGAVYYLFGGSFRRRGISTEDSHADAGHDGGGCCGGGHGSHHHGHEEPHEAVDAWMDPVCGMAVESKNAAATARYQGNVYYFCSEHCRDAFSKDPQKFVEKQKLTQQPKPHGGGHGCCG